MTVSRSSAEAEYSSNGEYDVRSSLDCRDFEGNGDRVEAASKLIL